MNLNSRVKKIEEQKKLLLKRNPEAIRRKRHKEKLEAMTDAELMEYDKSLNMKREDLPDFAKVWYDIVEEN